MLNIRTFSESDFRDAGEWLLAPKPLGWTRIPPALADALRAEFLEPLGMQFQAPPGVALCLFDDARCVYSFLDEPVEVHLDGAILRLAPHECRWLFTRRDPAG